MKDQEVSALVVRAPDNVLYLTNYWCMKGYDAVVFPREGDPTLIALEPQLADAQRNSWTRDIRLFKGYDERDPRPPQYRALDVTLEVLNQDHPGNRAHAYSQRTGYPGNGAHTRTHAPGDERK